MEILQIRTLANITTSVHLYASAKLALCTAGNDPALAKARDTVLRLLTEGGAGNLKQTLGQLRVGDMMRLGKAVLTLKDAGQEIVRGTRDEGEPLVRQLLLVLGVPADIADLVDRNTDHGMLFLAEAILKADERSPVPIPAEIVLYEAWRNDASQLRIPGMDAIVHGMRAIVYGNNDFCDLAEKDTRGAVAASQKLELLLKGIDLISEGAIKAGQNDIRYFPPAIRALGHGGVALCYYKRGDDQSARLWLKSLLDEGKQIGLGNTKEAVYLDVIYHCGGDDDEVATGKAALAKLSPPGDQMEVTDRQLLAAYCDANAETRTELARKISLTAKITRIALQTTRNAKIIDGLESSRIYRGTMGVAAMCEKTASSSSAVSGAVDALKGFLKSD